MGGFWGSIERSFATEPAALHVPVDVQAKVQKIPSGTGLEQSGLTIEASFVLRSSHEDFGGLSGLWLSDDRERMIAVSDKGQLWHAQLQHDARGRLLDVRSWTLTDIPKLQDDRTGWRSVDAEALAGDDSSLIVAYEGHHRLRRLSHENLAAAPERLPRLLGLGGPSNSGIESLANLGDGRLLAIAERVGAWGGVGLSAWLIDGDHVDDLVYVPTPDFVPTGADHLDEALYIVERQFSLLGGFRSRILTLPTHQVQPGAHLKGTALAAFRFGDFGENFEAITAKRAPDRRTLIYLLSDDNFSLFQRTVLLQLALPEPASLSAEEIVN
ncbi:MAG: esterase-like activity of phytase family protein [Geminicoccaceae bacterium]